jgi:phosphoglycolate phosphatase
VTAPVVGFDLDMTLLDARPGVVRVLRALAAERDVRIDAERFAANLGPPLERMLRDHGFEDERAQQLARRFRELYPRLAIEPSPAMPGADEVLDRLHRDGVRTVVVTGKYEPNARLHLEARGWPVDVLRGDVFAAAKGEALRAEGAAVYVGDHVGDIAGARAAGAAAVAVATGPFSREELAEAGADAVLDELSEFPAWFAAACAPRA